MATTPGIFRKNKDAGKPLDITEELTVNDLIRYTVPAGGPFVTGAPQSNTLTEGQEILLSPIATIAADTLSNPMTVADVLLFKEVSEAGGEVAIGNAVERAMFQRNRGQTMDFGDLQFWVPNSGNSSFQFRYLGGGSITISDFLTHWSHQQGGASEEAISFALGSSFRYFRTQGLTLTQHNNFQEAWFECNGWMYHVVVIVGGSWTNNRFSFTRWRIEGIKGAPGTNGTNGVDGADAASIDHISLTGGDSSAGTTDTYTLWGDAGETVSLGTYDVPIPAAQGIQTVLLGSYDGASSGSRTFTLAGGRTWQDVLDEFEFVYVLVGGNNLWTHDQASQFHVSDISTQNRDMDLTSYMTHGSNAYHFKMRCPAASSTTVTIDNDGSSMSVQRIRVRGIK